ncbi:hypothetical protein E3E38_00150 [Thermococcus sp. 18S1]|uniref:hypothetical protein n=1 Tax=Thermococcus sp. 18S1 TaxID=1638210 RepID=UPI00143AD4A1|nr:hypothetical protein [Thermococcus sp. 18S1]NJE29468.1 hypothetical protein [Thermococcus sp. 18S1]
MWGPINIAEILVDYFRHMRKDFRAIPLFIVLVCIPSAIAYIFYLTVTPGAEFYKGMITISSILIPLLLNLLMIVYYSVERTNKTEETKIEYLEHINSTISMTIFLSILLLFIAILFSGKDYTPQELQIIIFYLIGFLITNITIILTRIYRLIRYEINDIKNN